MELKVRFNFGYFYICIEMLQLLNKNFIKLHILKVVKGKQENVYMYILKLNLEAALMTFTFVIRWLHIIYAQVNFELNLQQGIDKKISIYVIMVY